MTVFFRWRPTWAQWDELQNELAELEMQVAENEVIVDEFRKNLEELRQKDALHHEHVEFTREDSARVEQKYKNWIHEIDEACALLVRQIDEPDAITDLVIDAISKLLDDGPT